MRARDVCGLAEVLGGRLERSDDLNADADERLGVFAFLTALFLGVALLAGGSSTSVVAAASVRLAGVPVLALALWRLAVRPAPRGAGVPLAILAAAAALTLLQLIPISPELWRRLPGRQTVLDGYLAARMVPPWLPLSLTPDDTWDAALGLVPPAAMLCAVLSLGARARRLLAWVVLSAALVSTVLAILQKIGGPDSQAWLYAAATRDAPMGLFANRNHQAIFLATIPPALAFLVVSSGRGRPRLGASQLVLAAAVAAVVAAGAVVTTSRAGIPLVGLGVLGSGLIVARACGGSGRLASWLAVVAAAVLVVAGATLALSYGPLAERLHATAASDLRLQLAPRVAEAGLAFAPVGSGVGSFPVVYQMFERPETITAAYVNHAHNDYLEIWLECGWPGLAIVAAFLLWWGRSLLQAVRSMDDPAQAARLCGCLVVALLLAHEVVDYPLRTPALATLFAFACGLAVAPTGRRFEAVDG